MKQRSRNDRPFVFINMAMSADGKIATADRSVSSFGSQRDKDHLHELRASADAILSGARTVIANNVTMGTGGDRYLKLRLRNGLQENALRIVVSGSGSIPPTAPIFKTGSAPVIVLTTARAPKKTLRALESVADIVRICGEKEIDWPETLKWLRKEWNVKRLLCEGGGELNDALFRADVVDELHLTLCPKIFGGSTAPTIAEGKGAASLSAATHMNLQSMRRVGDELFVVYSKE
ncbi:MAG TPA: dihydrofolate reductase family protein [Roseimicrobium sp.]|nr:dihydrofolate reductase family protein [Roseimicrobium sp.]